MKYCSNCGNELTPEASFCGNCGTPAGISQNNDLPTAPPAIKGKTTFSILTKERLKLVKVELENSAFRYEAGRLHYMKGKLTLEANVPGMGKIFKSMFTREKIVKPVISGTGVVYLEPSFGEFTILDLNDEEWIVDRGAYYASDIEIEIGMFTNSAISGLFSGEKWFQTAVGGIGKVIITSSGPLEEIELNNDTLTVDGSFAVARTSGVELQIKKASKGIFSSVVSGEGLVNTFTGTGKILIAPVSNYLNTIVSEIRGVRYMVGQIRNK